MALSITNAERVFVIDAKKENDKIKLPDPSASMEPVKVMRFYSGQYPELTTAQIDGPVMDGDKAVYTFKTIIGEKG